MSIDHAQLGGALAVFNPGNTPLLDQSFENIPAKLKLNWGISKEWMVIEGIFRWI